MGSTPDLLACYWTLCGPIGGFYEDDTSPRDFRARVEAAAKAGFTGIGIKDNDIEKVRARYGYDEMAQILRDNGIRHLEIEALFDWFTTGERRAASNKTRRTLLEAAEYLAPHHVKVVGDFEDLDAGIDHMLPEFDRLCEDFAAVSDVRVAVEVIPFSNVRDLATGLELVRSAHRKNAGLMLDIWHVTRGGIPYDEIAALPREFIAGVELDDAATEMQGDILEDTLYHRRLCGEGDFDIRGFLRAVEAAGYDGPIGVEVISREQMARPLDEAARRLYETTISQFAESPGYA